jgi:hypothetical protein
VAKADAPGSETATALLANPYLQGYRPAPGGVASVVPRHDRERAWPGLNLYVSGHAAEAYLVDMEGRPVHRWRHDLRRVWPELYRGDDAARIRALEYWRRAEVLPDGGLLAIFEGLGLVRLDRSSRLVWAYRGGTHHDLFVAPDGEIWTLDRRVREVAAVLPGRTVLEDLVTVLGPDGSVRRQLSVLEALGRSRYAGLARELPAAPDVLHTNTLERLGGTLPSPPPPGYRSGSLLLSLLTLDAVAVLDPEREEVVALLRGRWRRQHQPTALANGRLLLFDNGGARGYSQVLEVDPASGAVAWAWPDPPAAEALYSKTLGSCQRLPNGNTLVTESENGRALEVTPAGEVVWELRSPHRAGPDGELVATLFEVVRLPPDLPWLRRPAG